LQTADALQIKGLEKNNDLLSPYLGPTRLLSVPSHQVNIFISLFTQFWMPDNFWHFFYYCFMRVRYRKFCK